jgi:hypothetical protein
MTPGMLVIVTVSDLCGGAVIASSPGLVMPASAKPIGRPEGFQGRLLLSASRLVLSSSVIRPWIWNRPDHRGSHGSAQPTGAAGCQRRTDPIR